MKLDRFINNTAYHAVSGHRTSYRIGKSHIYGCECIDRIELRNRSVGRTDQWCRKHDVYDLQRL